MMNENSNAAPNTMWRRMVARLSTFAEAMEMSEAEFQARRLDLLEQRLREMERQVQDQD